MKDISYYVKRHFLCAIFYSKDQKYFAKIASKKKKTVPSNP
jgi:hypothetical protein